MLRPILWLALAACLATAATHADEPSTPDAPMTPDEYNAYVKRLVEDPHTPCEITQGVPLGHGIVDAVLICHVRVHPPDEPAQAPEEPAKPDVHT